MARGCAQHDKESVNSRGRRHSWAPWIKKFPWMEGGLKHLGTWLRSEGKATKPGATQLSIALN